MPLHCIQFLQQVDISRLFGPCKSVLYCVAYKMRNYPQFSHLYVPWPSTWNVGMMINMDLYAVRRFLLPLSKRLDILRQRMYQKIHFLAFLRTQRKRWKMH